MKVTNARKPVSTQRVVARSPGEWNILCQKAIEMSRKSQDPRLPKLEDALKAGKIQETLRSMGIVCDQDLLREFPPLET